eukprot:gene25-28_t
MGKALSYLWISALLVSGVASAEEEPPASSTFPVVTRAEVAKHKTRETGMWLIYKDGVYDITKFIPNHPGGKDKIVLAVGEDLEPFWNIYRQHYNSPLPMEILKSLRVATLHPDDVAAMNAEKAKHHGEDDNPYSKDPVLNPIFKFYQKQPINAEPPGNLLTDNWITPVDLWFVRNHHPVPQVDPQTFRLDVVWASDLLGKERRPGSASDETESEPLLSLSLDELKGKFKPFSVASCVQCGGNRRMEMSTLEKTNGSSWVVSAIANAKWKGVKLRDLLGSIGITEDAVFDEQSDSIISRIRHVHIVSIDGMEISIPVKKALGRFGDVVIAYEMNDEPLNAAHGFPLRIVVPGHVGVRNVKWANKIRLSGEEAHGPWQRGMAYKGFGPSVKSLEGIDVEGILSLQEQPVQSAITLSPQATAVAGETLTVKGYAYSGGGRGIVRVDVSVDGGKTWKTAELLEGKEQPIDRAWAWTFWECDFDIPEEAVGSKLQVICKATDASYNVQPDSVEGIWNIRGINNNAWHRITLDVTAPEAYDDEDE